VSLAAFVRVGEVCWGVRGQRSSRRGGRERVVVGEGVSLSGGAGERADAVQRAGVVAVPWPAGGEMQRPAAGVAGEAAGDLKQPAA
jgi:hypothetical protein